MSSIIPLAADVLVAVLLIGTIASSVQLSRRITRMKADEAGMRLTIGDLVVASTTAERAVAGLRATLDECDRTLADRVATAERYAADLSFQVAAGEAVIGQISAIVAQAGGGVRTAPASEDRAAPASEDRTAPASDEMPIRNDPQMAPRKRAFSEVEPTPNHERLGVAAAAALAMSERALGRLRSKAA